MLEFLKRRWPALDLSSEGSLLFLRAYYCAALFYVCSRYLWAARDWMTVRPERMVEIWEGIRFLPFPITELVLLTGVIAVLCSTLLFIESQTLRLLSFVLWLFAVARLGHAGSIDHNPHFFLGPLFFLSLIPGDAWKNFTKKKSWIAHSIHAAGISIALNLSFAGIHKLVRGVYDLSLGRDGLFSGPEALGWLLASETPQLPAGLTTLARWTLDNTHLVYPAFLAGIAFEVSAAFIAVYPRFHKILAVVGVAFFAVTAALMDVRFADGGYAFLIMFMLNPLREGEPRP